MDLIKLGIEQRYFSIDSENNQIEYFIKNNHKFKYSNPEEQVRAKTLVELIENYGYSPKNIDFEVSAQQGGDGKTRADIVIYHENQNIAYAVVEIKKQDTEEKLDKIIKQARSYAVSKEINCNIYAYKIGVDPIVTYLVKGKNGRKDEKQNNFKFDYDKDIVYAFLKKDTSIEEKNKHYSNLVKSTPHDLKEIFKRCHDEIWNGGEKNAQDSFDEFSKILFLKMYDEMETEDKHGEKYFFQTNEFQTEEDLKNLIEEKYNEAIKNKKVNENDQIILTPLNLNKSQIKFIVLELQKYSLINTDNDPKGLAFETFIEHYMKGEFGQFFTPRNIVDFMLKVSPINGNKFNKESKVLDPCCGSGSFLVHSIMNFRNKFPEKEKWSYFANNSVYGIELNDKISVTAKVNLALHDDGHDNVVCSNGLNADFKFTNLAENIDLILTNPPFGTKVKIKQDEKDKAFEKINEYYKNDKDLKDFLNFKGYSLTKKVFDKIDEVRGKIKKLDVFQDSISSEILFFELYYRMLKVGGIAQVVIPDGVLTNSTSQFFRDYLSEHFKILAVISLPQFTFNHYGAGVKSSILIIQKIDKNQTAEIKKFRKNNLKNSVDLAVKELEKLEKEKNNLDKTYAQKLLLTSLSKEIKETDAYKKWKKDQSDQINAQIKELKNNIETEAENLFKKESKFNYPIFMAIAENIGFDATGRDTNKNDLIEISEKLKEFLKSQNIF
jgi:type I restriction enzyme M protein